MKRFGILVLIVFSVIWAWGADINSWQDLNNVTSTGTYVLKTHLSSTSPGYDTYASSSANSGAGWVPINGGGTGTKFTGSFDGNGFTISDLVINRPNTINVGLFGHIGIGATIQDVGLLNVNIKGARGTGSLVGRVTGEQTTLIELCYVKDGTVTGDGATGGLVGSNNSSREKPSGSERWRPLILKCYANDVDVTWSTIGNGDKIGGLTGCNQKGFIEDSYAINGTVTVDNSSNNSPTPERIGGLAGCTILDGEILNSYTANTISIIDNDPVISDVGGLVGRADVGDSEVIDSYWNTDIYATSPKGTGLTTSEMQNSSNYTNWDFVDTWEIIGTNYPRLQDNPDSSLPVTLSNFSAAFIGTTPVIAWTTQSESGNAGWNVYRGTTQDALQNGEVTLLNSDLVNGAGTTSEPTNYTFSDEYAYNTNTTYYYWLESVSISGVTENHGSVQLYIPQSDPGSPAIPEEFGLYQNYPNPFNPTTTISFSVPSATRATVTIYNAKGGKVAEIFNGAVPAKEVQSILWDGTDSFGKPVTSGIYLYKMQTEKETLTKRMMLLK